MKEFIFIIGTSGVGKTTLAKGLLKYYNSVCIEQWMIPEFYSRNGTEEMTGILEELTCYENQKAMLFCFNKLGYKNIIASDFDDLRTRDIPKDFKGYKFITIKLICSDIKQLKLQMKNRPNGGLIDYELQEKANNKIMNRDLLVNEIELDITRLSTEEVLHKAIRIIDNISIIEDYDYKKPNKDKFYSWIFENKLR